MSNPEANGRVTLRREGRVAHVLFDRPEARNAFTWAMYDELDAICRDLSQDGEVRVVTFRGAGGKAFVAGSDIAQFADFQGAADGIAYERKMDRYFERLLAIPVPTIAIIEGWAVGGGLNIASCCDLRVATRDAQFGTPIARTIGNCVSMKTYARILDGFGEARTKRMLMLAEFIGAEEADACGYLARMCEREKLEETVEEIVARLLENAPLTLSISKAAIGRIRSRDLDPAGDLISLAYGSEDFRIGVKAFMAKQKPNWTGR